MTGVTPEIARRREADKAIKRAAILSPPSPHPVHQMRPWYLGTVYRSFPGGLDAAFDEASRIAAAFMDAGVCIFSPITHSHPIARFTTLSPADGMWVTLHKPFMALCGGMIFCRMPNWSESEGLKIEEEHFLTVLKRPVVYVDPDHLDLSIAAIKATKI